jgi:hypothetical protein
MKQILLVVLISIPRLGAFLVGLFGLFMLYATVQDAVGLAEAHQAAHERVGTPSVTVWQVIQTPPVLLSLAAFVGLAFLGLFGALHKRAPTRRRIMAGGIAALIIAAVLVLYGTGDRFDTAILAMLIAFAVVAALPVFLPHPFTMWAQQRR